MINARTLSWGLALLVAGSFVQAGQMTVRLPAGQMPVLFEGDIVVVGGSSAGVAAAVEAARAGARVFVAAPRPYLGEDLCGTYRLWLEPGEVPQHPLARAIFRDPEAARILGPGLPFTYQANLPSGRLHRDRQPPSRLRDGRWRNASRDSVQYDGDVEITLDLGEARELGRIHVLAYQRPRDFVVAEVEVWASPDGRVWAQAATIVNTRRDETAETESLDLQTPLQTSARFLKLRIKKTDAAKRVLLGEIIVEPKPEPSAKKQDEWALKPVRPLHVKRTLDRALLDAGVSFLYGCHPVGILRDADGNLAGVVIANRSGRQAIIAKVIIDATARATVARLAGARFAPYPSGLQMFERAVVGGDVRYGEGIQLRQRAKPIEVLTPDGTKVEVKEYILQIPMKDGSFDSFAQAEQIARDRTWSAQQLDASEFLFQVPPDPMEGAARWTGPWPGASQVPMGVFQPAGVERLYVLGGCAAISREAAAAMLRPAAFIEVGARLGRAAATLARELAALRGVHAPGHKAAGPVAGEIRLLPSDLPRFKHLKRIPTEESILPVDDAYDVVVVGGGTGGAPAGIGAARQGARTLVVEYLTGLGGVGTLGLISSYYHGNQVGFTSEVTRGADSFGDSASQGGRGWNVEWKMEWYRRALRQAGAGIWFGALGAGAIVEGNRVRGVVVATPHGPSVLLAKAVVDATGNADVAAAAGAACEHMDAADVAVQGTGLPPRKLGAGYTNTDYTFVDDTDVFDIWRAFVTAREKFRSAYDLGQLVDTRERRRIVGEFTLTPMDMYLHRTFPDTIVIAKSNFDTHGFTVHPMFLIRPPDREDIYVHVPLRCLLPKGLEGILVTGLGVSAHRDALPVIRMQADVQNQGYAAGVAAAMAARENKGIRELDIKALQKHLVEVGNLPESVLTETDPFPLPVARVRQAITNVLDNYKDLEVIFAQPETALPLLREAYQNAGSAQARLIYAHILGMMGDATGVETLAAMVGRRSWDKGWRYTGMGQFGPSASPLDSLVIALGRTRDPRALEPILHMLRQLTPDAEFSHFRAVALALEALGDPAAARPLAELLQKPGMSGYATTNITAALARNPESPVDTSTRNQELSELVLARALYRCGDYQGIGERILRQYEQGLHGIYARHAHAVLAEGRGSRVRSDRARPLKGSD